jgi:hypothetical protein
LAGAGPLPVWVAEGHANVAVDEARALRAEPAVMVPDALRRFRYLDPGYRSFQPRSIMDVSWKTYLAMPNGEASVLRAKATLVFEFIRRRCAVDVGRTGVLSDLLRGRVREGDDVAAILSESLRIPAQSWGRAFLEFCAVLSRELRAGN